jgi:hypothetical protein
MRKEGGEKLLLLLLLLPLLLLLCLNEMDLAMVANGYQQLLIMVLAPARFIRRVSFAPLAVVL